MIQEAINKVVAIYIEAIAAECPEWESCTLWELREAFAVVRDGLYSGLVRAEDGGKASTGIAAFTFYQLMNDMENLLLERFA
jgi:hypothetical protein